MARLQELCCCLLLFSGIAPSAALRPTTDNSFDLNADVQFSLEKTLKEEPDLPEHLISNMRSVIDENLLKGLPDVLVQPSARDPELQGQVASLLQEVQASSLEEKFAEQAELEKIPAEKTKVLLEMGSSVKELFNHLHLAETISGQVSKVQDFVGEHPEISGEIERYAEHARPSQVDRAQPLPPTLMEEMPDLAKKLLPMFKPTVLGMGQSNLSLLQSSSNMSSDDESAKWAMYTRFEAGISLTFPLPCAKGVCFKVPITLMMVKLFHYTEEKWFASNTDCTGCSPGFVIVVPGLAVTLEKVNFAFSPFIPVPAEATGFLPAQKSGFAATIGWKEENMTKLEAGTKWAPELKIAVGCSYLPISIESKKSFGDTWGARTEPMIELAGSYDFGSKKWGFGTTFKWRSAVSYGKDQYFVIFKFPLVTLKTGDAAKGPKWPSAVAFGWLAHLSR